jgi:hypothetical protein
MRDAPLPPRTAGRTGVARRARSLLKLAGAAALCALVAALWPAARGDAPAVPPSGAGRGGGRVAVMASAPQTAARTTLASPAAAADALAAALGEEAVPLASGVVIEGIDRDRPWVCAGEPARLSARVAGAPEPGAVARWIWPTDVGGAELQPGPALTWRAPAVAGSYVVRFQVCRDLGGRRVGVLADRAVEIEVRACGGGEGQALAPLRVGVAQRGHGVFAFHAVLPGGSRAVMNAWDFGDGAAATTTEPSVEHAYALEGAGPHEIKSFTVQLEARLESGETLKATAFALARAQPPGDEPPPVEIEISRWRPRSDGGWESDVVVRPANGEIAWEHVERVTQRWDGGAEVDTRGWGEVIEVEERLPRGGFRGRVTVSPAEAGEGTKQILDFLHGHDPAGKEVVVSWSPFKREAPTGSSSAGGEVPGR